MAFLSGDVRARGTFASLNDVACSMCAVSSTNVVASRMATRRDKRVADDADARTNRHNHSRPVLAI